MPNTLQKPRKRNTEVVHLPLEIPLWKASKAQAEKEHRTHVNWIQLAVWEALQKRGIKV